MLSSVFLRGGSIVFSARPGAGPRDSCSVQRLAFRPSVCHTVLMAKFKVHFVAGSNRTVEVEADSVRTEAHAIIFYKGATGHATNVVASFPIENVRYVKRDD